MPRVMPKNPTAKRERLEARGRPIKVDREANVIRGYCVAMLGPFKSEGRGEFDEQALGMIVELYKASPNGLKSRFTHPNESGGDGLGKFLGRSRDAFLSTCINADGAEVPCVRADLHIDPTSLKPSPEGGGTPLGAYIMDLAESDPGALSSSLVLSTDKTLRRDKDGVELAGEDGKPLPPLWRPKKLYASDVVDTGDAVDGFLSAASLSPRWTSDYLAAGEGLLNRMFAGQTRETVEARASGFLTRYLNRRYGEKKMGAEKLFENYMECPTCQGSGNCPNCGGTGVSESGKGDCYRCNGTGECDTCFGVGEVAMDADKGDNLAPGSVEERDDGFYAVFEDGSEEGPFETREEAEAAIAAKEMPASDEGAAARPSVDLLRRRLNLKMKRG
jgi:hypothetical protein